jgi:glycosyltransferase involved in cell wall biosynthesis
VSQSRARVILACNREAVEGVPVRWRHKVQLLSINGVSRHELVPLHPPRQNERFAVLSAGRLVALKGFDLALRAFAIFAERHAEADFTIIGKGPEQNCLEGLIRELGMESQARIENWMPRERLLARMRSCDVFLFASLRDGGGLVVVEAMAAGKPVICLDLGGPGLHVTEECGIKVPAHSPDDSIALMAQALEKLYKKVDLRSKMGQASRTRAEHVYTWDRVSDRLLKIYGEVLGAPSPEA